MVAADTHAAVVESELMPVVVVEANASVGDIEYLHGVYSDGTVAVAVDFAEPALSADQYVEEEVVVALFDT